MSAESKLFGTDGIRGMANNGTMNPFIIPKIGAAVGTVFSRGRKEDHRYRALLGKDTRLSNYMIETAMISGLTGAGMDVLQIGPMPTPAIAHLTESMRADVGIMLTASHNKFEDNGIKLFNPDGFKLSKEQEKEITNLVFSEPSVLSGCLAIGGSMGRAKRIDEEKGQYKNFVKSSVPKDMSFGGVRVVVDCAHGAGYEMAPQILEELDAEVVAIGVEPNGTNINEECGSTHPEALMRKVREVRADLGIALDGDADRVLLVDEKGHQIDGDKVLALIASDWLKEGLLSKPVVVGTSMSNLGLEHYLRTLGIELLRTDVGDQNILREMRDHGYSIGGEPSGHIILSKLTKTGDGIAAALQAMVVLQKLGALRGKASWSCHPFEAVPQSLTNVRFKKGQTNPLENPQVQEAIAKANASFGGDGRVLVRPSGTEPLIRVMVESNDKDKRERIASELVQIIREEIR